MDWLDYREKLKIGFNDEGKEKYFFTKVFNVLFGLCKISEIGVDVNEYINFMDETGTSVHLEYLSGDNDRNRYADCVAVLHDHSNDLCDFLAYYISFVNSLNKDLHSGFMKGNFISVLRNNLEESHIPYDLMDEGDKIYVFPKGAGEMDDALVSEPLEWLEKYPKARTAFTKALREYADQTEDNASDIADKFRKVLETFMQDFFDTDKSLENCKALYGGYLKKQGVPSEITGNLETLLQAYTNYINNYAKHKDRTQRNVLEYLLYQTGNIIRLLITLKDREEKNTD